MKINWTVLTEMIGVGFGYSTHQRELHAALVRAGVTMDDNSDVAVHLTTPQVFRKTYVPGKFNILYTMFESNSLPESWIEDLKLADLIVVPCKHNKYLFERYTKTPVEICTEGVDTDKFTYYERTFPTPHEDGNPFIFLWSGATNARKGYDHVIQAWGKFNKNLYVKGLNDERTKFVLIMKTTQEADGVAKYDVHIQDKNGRTKIEHREEKLDAERIVRIAGNTLFDTRRLPITRDVYNLKSPGSLVEYYHAAHCFLFPTRGEGFGLTLAEAMATGCPVIYTPWSGCVDFCDESTGYPLNFKFIPAQLIKWDTEKKEKVIDCITTAADVDNDHLVRRMTQVWKNYDLALTKGKKAAERIRQGFTWDISARIFINIIEKYTGERLEAVA
jgi:glycosyltransferase involved in cell wall biosynthesis